MNDRPPEGIDAHHGRVSQLGENDVAIRNQHDDTHLVGALDRQKRLLSSLGGRADEGTHVKRAVGHDAVERRDDLGVVQVDLRSVQPCLGDSHDSPWPRRHRPWPDRRRPRPPAVSPWH